MAFNLAPKNLNEPTQELPGAALADLITQLAEAVAEGQARLDLSSAQVLQELAQTRVPIVPSIRQTIAEGGSVSYEQAEPVEVSLLELGMLPTFFAFSEATVEVAMDLKVVEEIESSETIKSQPILFAATRSLQSERRLNRDVRISTKMAAKLVPVPPPSRFNVTLETVTVPSPPPTLAASPNQFAPKQGITGTQVTLFGNNLNFGTPRVRFDKTAATIIGTPTANQIVVAVPSLPAGPVKITVRTDAGRVTSKDTFNVVLLPFAIAIPQEIIPIICQTLFTLEYTVVSAPFPNLITSLWQQIEGTPLIFLDPPTNRIVRVQRPLTETGPFRFQVTVTDGNNTFVGEIIASNIPTARALAGYKFGISSLFEDLKIKLFLRPNHGNQVYQLTELTEAYFGWFPVNPEASDTQVLRYEVLKLNRSTGQFQIVQTVLLTEALIHKGTVGEYYQVRAYLGSEGRWFFVESQVLDLFERDVPGIKNLYVDRVSEVGCKLGFIDDQEAHKTIEEIQMQGNISSAVMGTSFGFSQLSQNKIIEQAKAAHVLDIASVNCGLGFSNIQFTKIVEGGGTT